MKKWFFLAACLFALPLAAEFQIVAISGSTRADSFNKKVLAQAVEIAREHGAKVTLIDLKEYPILFYDGDLERDQGMPENAKRIRDMMIASQAIIIASPEYNGSISAVLKNVIDWTSRDEQGKPSRAAYKGKKVALLSASPGRSGGARALAHLRTIIDNVGAQVVSTQTSVPEAYQAFDIHGKLINQELTDQLTREIEQLFSLSF